MATKKTEPKEEPKVDLIKARAEGLTLLTPLEKESANFVIETEEDYLEADQIFSRAHAALKAWESRIDPPIADIRRGLDALYALKNDVSKPLEAIKADIKKKMTAYKVAEQRQIQAAREAEEAERQRLQKVADDLAAKAETAKTKARVEDLITKRATVEQAKADVPTTNAKGLTAGGSSPVHVPKWRITDLGLLMGHILEANEDLTSLVEVNTVQMNAFFKLKDPKPGDKWLPGVEVYTDIEIRARGSR